MKRARGIVGMRGGDQGAVLMARGVLCGGGLAAVLCALALAGCPRGGGKGPVGPGPGGHGGAADAGPTATVPAGGTPAACAQPTRCMFHPGAGAYFVCLNAADGACAHYGPACAPADHCLFDPATHANRHCDKVVMGKCAAPPGDFCAPADHCLFDPASAIYRTCTKITSGRCETFTDPC